MNGMIKAKEHFDLLEDVMFTHRLLIIAYLCYVSFGIVIWT